MMEKIKINSIEKKDSGLVIVKYGALDKNIANCEATLNTKWQSQEVNYLENDVGLGGEVSVLIEQKGQYTNITKVDFKSAVKGNVEDAGNENAGFDKEEEKHMPSIADERSKSIIAQCLVKAVIGNWGGGNIDIIQAVNMYKEALELLG